MTDSFKRRQFLKLTAATSLSGFFLPGRTRATEEIGMMYQNLIPARKELDAEWALSLAKRGAPRDAGLTVTKKEDLARIGMTVGGIGCGTVYLSGDGRLYVWDVFHQPHAGVVAQQVEVPKGFENISGAGKKVRELDGANYLSPPTPDSHPNPFRQGFELTLNSESKPRPLDASGWSDVKFTGRWPLGLVDYADAACPVAVRLEAWTPFIPLETLDSSIPVTVMEYTLENRSKNPVSGVLNGIWENPVYAYSKRRKPQNATSQIQQEHALAMLIHRYEGDLGTAVLAAIGENITGDASQARLSVPVVLPPGGKQTVRFLLTWHFPNMQDFPGVGKKAPQYTTRFADAAAVAREVTNRFKHLRDGTMRWVAAWNDSTLPQWLMDRSILTTNTLQTTNCHVLENGRFWAWEGIGCCAGTCAHVWHYAQGVARLFPDLERNLREVTDFGVAINDDGGIRFRAEANNMMALDSQTGVILRTWREHLVSPDSDFLKRVWPGAKRALGWLIRFDESGRGGLDGLLDGKQHNTLDAEWYGKVHCLCSMYLAALRAGQEMAREIGDSEFADTCGNIHAMGSKKIATLFNGEFYTQEEDPEHSTAIGVGLGCYIDQVIGQWWATLSGLGRIQDAGNVRSALNSLWKYNYVPEIGSFRRVFKQGRFYAMPGEAGLIMCTWPKGGLREDFKKHWQYAYFNECMSGFEWQAAAHMVQEGTAINAADYPKISSLLDETSDPRALTLRGLAVGRSIHDRYSPTKRNPYNEIECSDHYARANASYSLFLAVCGFSYNGPAGMIGFDPKIGPENFKAPFTAAQGWGTFEQNQQNGSWNARLKLVHGSLTLREIRLPWLRGNCRVTSLAGNVPATIANGVATFSPPLVLHGPSDEVTLQEKP